MYYSGVFLFSYSAGVSMWLINDDDDTKSLLAITSLMCDRGSVIDFKFHHSTARIRNYNYVRMISVFFELAREREREQIVCSFYTRDSCLFVYRILVQQPHR